jgi:hypothetical protein
MVAGISGTAAGSGAVVGADENDGRLMLPQAPRNIASAEAIPRLATARALHDLTRAFPQNIIRGRIRPATKRKTAVGAMMAGKLRPSSDLVSKSILYRPRQRITPFA